MRSVIAVSVVILLAAPAALGAAWTLDQGRVQIISGVTSSSASKVFDDSGAPSGSISFNKMLVQNWMEYGLTDSVTLFAAPEYVMAEANMDGAGKDTMHSASVEAGLRVLLLSRIGMLSLQSSIKTGGAFHMSVSEGGKAGRQMELRLLYGRSFKLFRRDAFFDIQAAEHWIKYPRPNEFIVDVTAGIWLKKSYLFMLQSFNTFSDGRARPPYTYYRLHKVQASLVQRITPRWSVQGGYFYAIAGQNIVQEQGFVATLWYNI